jgi:RNA polymerase-binding transcription factor DksA
MTTRAVLEYEDLLLESRDRLLHDLRQLESEEEEPQVISGGGARRWVNGADVASDVQEQESDFVHLNRISHRLEMVDDALDLLRRDPEEFGTCRFCGGEIRVRRLQLVPWSRLCSRCARGEEGLREGA